MKAQMKIMGFNKVFVQTLGCALAVLVTVPTMAQESARKPVDPRGQFAKLTGVISASDSQLSGNAFIVGTEGCYIATNYHVAFGESVDETGKVKLVPREKRTTERVVNFSYDLDAKAGKFRRNVRAKVVQFGGYQNGTLRGMMGDLTVLRLETCAGKEYGQLKIDRPAPDKDTPVGKLTTFSAQRSTDGSYRIVSQKECTADRETTAIGLFVSDCEVDSGDSGSMVLESIDGELRLTGMFSKSITSEGKLLRNVSVFSTELLKILDPVLGTDAPLAVNPLADTRAPQSDLASAAKTRTVVR